MSRYSSIFSQLSSGSRIEVIVLVIRSSSSFIFAYWRFIDRSSVDAEASFSNLSKVYSAIRSSEDRVPRRTIFSVILASRTDVTMWSRAWLV